MLDPVDRGSPGATVDSLTEPVALRQTDQPVLAVSRRTRGPCRALAPAGIGVPPCRTAAVGPVCASRGLRPPITMPSQRAVRSVAGSRPAELPILEKLLVRAALRR
jgi:hypothetical protein